MTTTTEAMRFGIRFFDDEKMSPRVFSDKVSEIEAIQEPVECSFGVRKSSSRFRTFISKKHGALTIFPNTPKKNQLTVVFRQSFCYHNWISNMQWLPRTEDSVHTGIHEIAESLLDFLLISLMNWMNFLREERDTLSTKVYFTGMSLGGALAVLVAYRCRLRLKEHFDSRITCEVIPFASPKVGLRSFAKEYNDILGNQTTNYFSPVDLFANSPPHMAGDYAHVGQIIHTPDFGFGGRQNMLAHSKILGVSWMHGLNALLGMNMIYRGRKIMKHWGIIYDSFEEEDEGGVAEDQ